MTAPFRLLDCTFVLHVALDAHFCARHCPGPNHRSPGVARATPSLRWLRNRGRTEAAREPDWERRPIEDMTMEQLNWRGIETEPTDAALIDRSRLAPETFAALFDRHGDRVYRYLARRVGADDADDLVSETFVVAFEQRHTFDPSRSPAGALPWLLGIGTNLVRGHHRAELRRWNAVARSDADITEPSPADRVAAKVDAQAQARVLLAVLAEIPESDRDALLLFAWADLKYEEIAAALGVPIGTVRSRIHRARTRLRAVLTVEDTDDRSDDHG